MFDNEKNPMNENTQDSEEQGSDTFSENTDYKIDSDDDISGDDSAEDNIPDSEFDPFSDDNAYEDGEAIPTEDTEAASSQNEAALDPPVNLTEGKRTGGIKGTFLLLSVLISCISLVGALMSAYFAISATNDLNSLRETVGEIQKIPQSNTVTVTYINNDSVIWENPDELEYRDAIANATESAIDSAVIIEGYASESATDLDSPVSAGSGVLFASAENGTYIVTCNHVIDSAKKIRVILNNKDEYFADIIGKDVVTDLAVLKINATGLKTIVLPGDNTNLRLGQTVIAIGNPLGMQSNSVTSGVISALTRSVKIEGIKMNLLQMDASVNSGNSGGGLFDINGRLVGIVNAKSVASTVEGIGFAIPFQTVKSICEELITNGYVTGRPAIGISFVVVNSQTYTSVFNTYPDLVDFATEKTTSIFGERTRIIEGFYITGTEKVSGYAEGSEQLQFGDRIVSISGKSISSTSDIVSILAEYSTGDTFEVTVSRGGKTIVTQIILGQAK